MNLIILINVLTFPFTYGFKLSLISEAQYVEYLIEIRNELQKQGSNLRPLTLISC